MNFDLFASHLNNKYPDFCSYTRQPGAFHINAFTFDWNSKICYCFPPFRILGQCMEEIKKQDVQNIYFVIPSWRTAIWFPQMIELLNQCPIVLPRKVTKGLTLPWTSSKEQMLPSHLRLAFVGLSNNFLKRQVFLQKLQNFVPTDGEPPETRNTPDYSITGSFIVYKHKKIPIIFRSTK